MLIGLMGHKRSGKDTFAAGLAPYDFTRLAFADAMKDALVAFNPIVTSTGYTIRDYIDNLGWEAAKERPLVRQALQNFGAAMRDRLGDHVWTEPVVEQIEELQEEGRNLVVTDVRYRNEARIIKNYGGLLVAIVRPDLPDDGDTHPSETDIPFDLADFTVVNDGSIEGLRALARVVVLHSSRKGAVPSSFDWSTLLTAPRS